MSSLRGRLIVSDTLDEELAEFRSLFARALCLQRDLDNAEREYSIELRKKSSENVLKMEKQRIDALVQELWNVEEKLEVLRHLLIEKRKEDLQQAEQEEKQKFRETLLLPSISELLSLPLPRIQEAVRKFDGNLERAIEFLLDSNNPQPPEAFASVLSPSPSPAPVPSSSVPNLLDLTHIASPPAVSQSVPAARPPSEPKQYSSLISSDGVDFLLSIQEEERRKRERFERASEEAVRALLKAEEEERQRKRLEEAKRNEELVKKLLEEERKEKERQNENRLYHCLICSSDHRIADMYILDECSHRFCRDCLRKFFKTKINDGHTRDIRCPSLDCKRLVTYHEVKHCVDRETFDKYEKFLLAAALGDDPNVRWCPRPGCGNAMIVNPCGGYMLRCNNPKCNFAFCSNCKEEWHADITCEQYRQWKLENSEADRRFERWATANTKRCPSCHVNIEKNGGCNHMRCENCRYEFCWLCLREYTADHFKYGSCKQFT